MSSPAAQLLAVRRERKAILHESLLSQSQNELISILAEDVKNKIVNDAGMYSFMADTLPDTSNEDRLVTVDKENCPQEGVVEMRETSDKTGQGQANDILKSLDSKVEAKGVWRFKLMTYSSGMITSSIIIFTTPLLCQVNIEVPNNVYKIYW